MLAFRAAIVQNGKCSSPSEYRLNGGPFYFMLCSSVVFEANSAELITGMNLPLDYWEVLVGLDKVRGKKGGVGITDRNVDRYIENTEIIQLEG